MFDIFRGKVHLWLGSYAKYFVVYDKKEKMSDEAGFNEGRQGESHGTLFYRIYCSVSTLPSWLENQIRPRQMKIHNKNVVVHSNQAEIVGFVYFL